jgi:putative GTP pyrophosphokinase
MTTELENRFSNSYDNRRFELQQFLSAVRTFFELNPSLNGSPLPIIHSIKYRMKSKDSFIKKVERKLNEGKDITDFIGIRILHIHQQQFEVIHHEIQNKINIGDWALYENPKALLWDPESVLFYQNLGLETQQRETYYTSVHYIIKPNNQNVSICCEVQVRTLFEEIWGEIDHTINYPEPTNYLPCREQLRVLSKLVSTGTRLSDSIFRTHEDYIKTIKKQKRTA